MIENMEDLKISDGIEFSKIVQERYLNERRGEWVFRGISNAEYKLLPSIARIEHKSRTFEKFEKSIFDIFKRNAIQYINYKNLNDYEWLALAQHHSLPTRLLDWTFNPNIALFFACRENFNKDSCVYALKAMKKLSLKKIRTISPFKLDKPYKILAPTVTKRIFAQEGLFTIFDNPLTPLDENIRNDWVIERVFIPKEIKESTKYWLFKIGIDESHLFPDLDGLSNHLKWQHSVLPPDEFYNNGSTNFV